MYYNDPAFNSYADYYAYAKSRGNTPLTEDTIAFYVSQARAHGISDARMQELLATNTADWGRFNTAFDEVEGAYAQPSLGYVGGGNAFQSITTIPPVLPTMTAGGDQRMYLSLQDVPTAAGGGMPARQLAPMVAAGSTTFGSSLFSVTSPTGGLDLVKLAILAGVVWAGWHLLKKGSLT
jgi:hypothetical protein